ncbi:hypothetical protein UlMin_017614 [Ulmus minor]
MRDFPACVGKNGVQNVDSSSSNNSKNAQNLVTCIYQCRVRGRSSLITVTWSRNLMGQGLTIAIDDSFVRLILNHGCSPGEEGQSFEAFSVKFISIGTRNDNLFRRPGYYVAVVVHRQMVLLLGDLRKEAFKKTSATRLCCQERAYIWQEGFPEIPLVRVS